MHKVEFMKMLAGSQLQLQKLARLKVEASGRLAIHRDLYDLMLTTDEKSCRIHVNHVTQTQMEIDILELIMNYQKFMNEDRRPQEEVELSEEKFSNNQENCLAQPSDSFSSGEKRRAQFIPSSSSAIAPPLRYTLPVEAAATRNSCTRPLVFGVVHSNSPTANESTTNLNDFPPEGLRRMLDSTVTSIRARQQLMSYISQLQINTVAHSSNFNSAVVAHNQNSTSFLRVSQEITTIKSESE